MFMEAKWISIICFSFFLYNVSSCEWIVQYRQIYITVSFAVGEVISETQTAITRRFSSRMQTAHLSDSTGYMVNKSREGVSSLCSEVQVEHV